MSSATPKDREDQPTDVFNTTTLDDPKMKDRLGFLEKEYRQLSGLFHDLLAKPRLHDQEEEEAEPESREGASTAACEITRLSSLEWRALEDRSLPRNEYSLLTVGPKGRGESALWNQTIKVQREASKAAVESSAGHLKASNTSDENVYRLILNGRAELMEVLGGIFNSQSLPGFYIWIWPFKYLIRYESKVRARLLEEESESKLKDIDEYLALRHNIEAGTIPNRNHLYRSRQQSSGSPWLDTGHVNGEYPHPGDRGFGGPHDDSESEKELPIPDRAARLEHVAEDRKAAITTHEQSQMVDRGAVPDGRAVVTAPDPQHSTARTIKIEDRTRLRDELRCLVKFIDDDMKDIYSVQKGIDDGTRTTIAFDHLWQLFKPGDLVIRRGEHIRAYIVLHVTGGRALYRNARSTNQDNVGYVPQEERKEREAYLARYPRTTPFVLDCFYLDFDGANFGPLPEKVTLQEYDGEIPISSLEVFPARFDASPKQTEKALIKRGKRFVKLARVDHKYYSGKTVREPAILETQGEVHGEIMIDFDLAIKAFRKANAEWASRSRWLVNEWNINFGSGVIANPTPADEREVRGYDNLIPVASAQYKPTYFMEDATYDNELRADFIDKTSLLKERPYHEQLSKEALMLLPPRVYGFSLLDRKWYAFNLNNVEDIKGTNQGFDNLVLPDEHKKIMQALVQHHTKGPASANSALESIDQDFSMDVVRGKGRGLIILLHGVPGTGKTSTAECVAAQTRRPLFPITCGDIGTYPSQVEETLSEYFDMAHKWGCVLLLDEADVFLAKREKGGDLVRNGIVSVFLRVLEYYSGILILTTNRIGEFDEAFSSRIHVKLYYPKLDKKSTLEIWKMNLKRLAESELDIDVEGDEIRNFARKLWADSADKQTQRWNGRQIRNAFQSAIALAKWDFHENASDSSQRPCLSVQQFEVVAKTSAHFDAYISTMHGIDEVGDAWETIAQRELLRKNDTPRKPTSRSAAAARAVGGRRRAVKEETPDEDEDEDDTDSDDNEEKVKKLQAELDRRQKKNATPVKRSRDTQAGQSQKSMQQAKAEEGDSSTSSDEAD